LIDGCLEKNDVSDLKNLLDSFEGVLAAVVANMKMYISGKKL